MKFFRKKKDDKEIDTSIHSFDELWNAKIEDIWKINERNSFVIAMNGWVCRKCDYGDSIDKLSPQERIFYIVQTFESEVNNGGIAQCFYNSSGNFVDELVVSFMAIGADNTATICKKILDVFGCKVPVNREEREEFLDKVLTEESSAILKKYDYEFYKYVDNLEELNEQYINKNKEYFS